MKLAASAMRSAKSLGFMRLLTTWILAIVIAPEIQAQSDLDVINNVADLLDQGGIGSGSYPPLYPMRNPQGLHGANSLHPDGTLYIGLNVGYIRQIADQLYAQTGYVLSLDSPFALAYLLYVAIHEIAHSNCCHAKGDSVDTTRENCQELLADINGAKATCQFIKDLIAGLNGQPPSEFMSTLLHLLCQHIQDERAKYNNAHGRFAARDCYNWAAQQDGDGDPATPPGACECTADSWDPPKADPCSDCPGFPNPGSNPQDPFGGGDVIPNCEDCDNI